MIVQEEDKEKKFSVFLSSLRIAMCAVTVRTVYKAKKRRITKGFEIHANDLLHNLSSGKRVERREMTRNPLSKQADPSLSVG